MSLEEPNKLDMVYRDSDEHASHPVHMVIFDHGQTEDESERYAHLTRKLATYVSFVMSENFRTSNPSVMPTQVLIHVLCQRPPNVAMTTIQAIYPKGDRVNRIAVVFEDLEQFRATQGKGLPV